MLGYKVLSETGKACYGGHGQWLLPEDGKPGPWMPTIKNVIPCQSGYHFCRDENDLIHWLGPVIYRIEVKKTIIEHANKAVASDARLLHKIYTWNERTARIFAAECALTTLKYVKDEKIRDVIERTAQASKDFANGLITVEDLSAARSAAWSAARSATWSAARSAAESAAWSAARSATWSAARSAAEFAAESAARSAAEFAAESAARSATWSAAKSAARSAAWSEQEEILKRLLRL